MALSNIDSEHANKLLSQINTNFDVNSLEAVKTTMSNMQSLNN
jgi:hypothetical protein